MRRLLFALSLLLLCPPAPAQRKPPDTTDFVVVGGGLSAGFSNFQLTTQSQKDAYPALVAKQIGTVLPLATFRDPSPGVMVSFDPLANLLPRVNQSVLRGLPFPLFTLNLSVPMIRVSESLARRPSLPVVAEGDLKQTMINLILGYPALILDNPPKWSQVEYAELMFPTFSILELGFGDVAEAAITGETNRITQSTEFAQDYAALANRIRRTFATVVVMNIPDPTDTAFFAKPAAVAQLYSTDTKTLTSLFGIQDGDLVTVGGMVEIGQRLAGRVNSGLSANSVLKSASVKTIQSAVQGFNNTISTTASRNGFALFDLNALFKEVADRGIQAGSTLVKGGYAQGFYSRDGIFPTATGQAIIANRLLTFLNSTYGTNYSLVDVASIARQDKQVPQFAGEADSESATRVISVLSESMRGAK